MLPVVQWRRICPFTQGSRAHPSFAALTWYRMQPRDQTSLGRPTLSGAPPMGLLTPPWIASGLM